jgi:hypothetical protein
MGPVPSYMGIPSSKGSWSGYLGGAVFGRQSDDVIDDIFQCLIETQRASNRIRVPTR